MVVASCQINWKLYSDDTKKYLLVCYMSPFAAKYISGSWILRVAITCSLSCNVVSLVLILQYNDCAGFSQQLGTLLDWHMMFHLNLTSLTGWSLDGMSSQWLQLLERYNLFSTWTSLYNSSNLFSQDWLYRGNWTGLQVHKAVDACKSVLRGLHSNRIVPRELDRVSFFPCV